MSSVVQSYGASQSEPALPEHERCPACRRRALSARERRKVHGATTVVCQSCGASLGLRKRDLFLPTLAVCLPLVAAIAALHRSMDESSFAGLPMSFWAINAVMMLGIFLPRILMRNQSLWPKPAPLQGGARVAPPRQNSLVRVDFASLGGDRGRAHPFEPGGSYVFLGEIPNMPGHCVVADQKTGKVHSAYPTRSFIEVAQGRG